MSFTISTVAVGPVTLSGAGDDPASITATGLLESGIYTASLGAGAWTVTNAGTVLSNTNGIAVSLASAGLVDNSGDIAGRTANGAGVDLNAGGYVLNHAGGTITGYWAIEGATAPLTLANLGTIAFSTVGAFLFLGGSVTNAANGVINAGLVGILGSSSSEAVVVANAGRIGASVRSGILLQGGGNVNNTLNGAIYGYNGIDARGVLTVTNAGSISGTAFYGAGIALQASGTIVNMTGGGISGLFDGIDAKSGIATIVNYGGISAAQQDPRQRGILLAAGGRVTNVSGGSISGFDGFSAVNDAATFVNAGHIAGNATAPAGIGVTLAAGGYVLNQAAGTISGYQGLVASGGGVTLVNAGSIAGAHYAVRLGAGDANRLVVSPGAYFSGTVSGGNTLGASAISTLELATGAVAGTLSGLGTRIVDFAQVTVDTGADWVLGGADTIAVATIANGAAVSLQGSAALTSSGSVVNDGSIALVNASATLAALTGTGSAAVGAGGTLAVQGTVASGETIDFTSGGGWLTASPAGFSGEILGFANSDTIALSGIAGATGAEIVNGDTLRVAFASTSAVDLRLDPDQDYSAASFRAVSDSTNTYVTTDLCFCQGTLILTPAGERPVESLQPGDAITNLAGVARVVLWTGIGHARATPGRRGAATPVIIRKGALADDVPHRDLKVTRAHALLLDGILIPAEFLINHHSILWDDSARATALYHIELETHDVLLANGAAAESYRDDGNRHLFDNAGSGRNLPDQQPCAPMLTGGPIVDSIWRRLLDRARAEPGPETTAEADLHLLANGRRVYGRRGSEGTYVFDLPHRPSGVRLVSRAASPSELGLGRDPRTLGVAVRQVRLWRGRHLRVLDAADPAFAEGFHGFEPDNKWRWTDGNAGLPDALFAGVEGACQLELCIAGETRYPLAAPEQDGRPD